MEWTKVRKCVWCGAPANSKEHVYPKWLRKFEAPSSYIAEHGAYQDTSPTLVTRFNSDGELIESEETRGRKTPNLHEVQVKVVCRDCNSGWMSRMEKRIEPVVQGLSRHGTATSVSEMDQSELAIWAHKTFLMYDQHQNSGDKRYPDGEYSGIYAGHTIASDTHICIARSRSPYAGFGMWSDSRTLVPGHIDDGTQYVREHRNNCGSAYLAIDGLVIFEQWYGSEYPAHDRAADSIKRKALRTLHGSGIQTIWPVQETEIGWPPRVLNHRRTERARLALFNTLSELNVLARRIRPASR